MTSFVKNAVLSVAAGSTMHSVVNAVAALSQAQKGRGRVELPVSPAGMEYFCRKKPDAMLAWISEAVRTAKNQVSQVVESQVKFLKCRIVPEVHSSASWRVISQFREEHHKFAQFGVACNIQFSQVTLSRSIVYTHIGIDRLLSLTT